MDKKNENEIENLLNKLRGSTPQDHRKKERRQRLGKGYAYISTVGWICRREQSRRSTGRFGSYGIPVDSTTDSAKTGFFRAEQSSKNEENRIGGDKRAKKENITIEKDNTNVADVIDYGEYKQRFEATIPIRVFLLEKNTSKQIIKKRGREVVKSVFNLVSNLDDYKIRDDTEIIGSYFRQIFIRFKNFLSKPEMDKAISKGYRALDAAIKNKTQAEADKKLSEAIAKLIEAVGDVDAIIQVGSILLVKIGDQIFSKTLTDEELEFIEDNPAILKDSKNILDSLNNLERPSKCRLLD
jgi:hypothetical protein